MALPAVIAHSGVMNGSPAAGSVGAPSLIEIMNTSFSATYSGIKGGRPSIVGATAGSPFTIPFETLTKVRLLLIRVNAGTIQMKVTTPQGTDQIVPISGIFMLHVPFAGDEVTAIKLIGTADIEYLIAGDTT